jgi:purine-binding chemotaxis protein CheW
MMMAQELTANSKESGHDGGYAEEYLTYTLGVEEYAIDILKVQEIRGYEPPTTIANAPPSSRA